MPFSIICVVATSSTSVTEPPFLIVMDDCTKFVSLICTTYCTSSPHALTSITHVSIQISDTSFGRIYTTFATEAIDLDSLCLELFLSCHAIRCQEISREVRREDKTEKYLCAIYRACKRKDEYSAVRKKSREQTCKLPALLLPVSIFRSSRLFH